MTTPTPDDLSARHVEVLRAIQKFFTFPDDAECKALDAAIAALSALPAGGGEQCPFCLRGGKHPRHEECPALNAPTTFTLTETTTPQPSAAEEGGSPESEMQKVIDKVVDGVMGQREEVLRAFVAKYGFQPDEAVQVSGPDGSWRIIRRSDMHANPDAALPAGGGEQSELRTLAHDMGAFLNANRASLPSKVIQESYALHNRLNAIAWNATTPPPDAAVGAQRDGKELARMHADYTVDERGRESWDFDAHGLANFVRDLTAAPAAGKGVDANCWSADYGDTWLDCPDDAEFVHGLKVGDEYELQASVYSWAERFRVTKVPDDANDDYEIERVSPPALTRQSETCQCAECRRNIALARAGSPFIMDPLPERDPSRANAEQGLYRKFDVRRTDGSDAPGGKHHGCEYFVLDVKHDPLARAALAGYADAAEATHPQLAADLRERYTLTRQPVAGDDLPPLHARLYESTPEEIAEALRYLAVADAVAVALTRQPVAGDGWRPIESAPKDGSQFLVWTNRLGFAVVTHAVDDPMPQDIVPSGHHLHVDDGKFGPYPIRGDYPTRWQPLPAAPAATPTDGEAASA